MGGLSIAALESTLLRTSVGESEGSDGRRFLVEGPDMSYYQMVMPLVLSAPLLTGLLDSVC